MDASPVDSTASLPTPALILISIVLATGVLLWLSPWRLRRSEIGSDALRPWQLSWVDFGLWLAGLYFAVVACQIIVFQGLPQFFENNPPWHPDTGQRAWLLLAAGLSLQFPLILVFFALRRYQPQLYGIPLAERIGSRPPSTLNAMLIFLMIMPLVTGVAIVWNGALFALEALGLPVDRNPQELVQTLARDASFSTFIIFFVLAVAVAPIAEELVFRGGIYRFFKSRVSRNQALLISAVLFAFLHANLASFMPLVFLGVALGIVYEITGSIRAPILLHAVFNAYQFAMIFLVGEALA